MRTPALPSPRRIAVGAGLALLAAGLTPITASANTAGTALVISEVYGGGGNGGATYTHDFIELYNPTSSAISVADWSVQYRSATGTSATLTNLTGSVPAGGHYLVQEASNAAVGAALPAPDATGSIAMSGANGVVLLVSNQTAVTTVGNLAGSTADGLVDVVGYGTTPTTFEGANTGVALTSTTAATRNATGVDTDQNANDFSEVLPDPQNSGPVVPTALEATAPGSKSGQVGQAITGFTLAATGGTSPYTWTATGLPDGVTVASNGDVSGTPTTAGDFSVVATATDSATPTAATDDVDFSFTVTAAASLIPIADVQGTGATTPLLGQNVKTEGVVTASYPTGGLNGFYIQTPGADTADASDAIFVYGGTGGFATYPAVGDSVEVTGQAAEFSGQTQIAASQAGVTSITSLGDVTPRTVVPGTDCALPGTACLADSELNTVREVVESELFQPTAPWTATDVYDGSPFYQGTSNSSSFRGEIGVAAQSDMPLVSPTEVVDAQATALVAERTAYNNAHRIVMDDGSTLTYSTTQNANQPFPWFTADHTVRVGAEITFPKPVVFTEGFSTWRILPQSQIVGAPTGKINVEQTRPASPQNVGGDVKLATFNVLNFFPTTGEEYATSGAGTCTYYNDKDGAPVTVNSCTNNGPRGAANDANLVRQRNKIVAAINTADADIVSLEELENSVKFGKNRDFAINALVSALNADAGTGTWAAVPSPATLPTTDDQDVIRNGFIYQPANVALVGESVVLSNESSTGGAFEDAREPLAQAFKQVGTADGDAFAVIVNHFKSKGSGTADPFGQGNANDRRIIQANSLVSFADSFKTQRGITRVFLAGDFNAYTQEDPIQVLNAAGYTSLESTSNPDEETYNFDGQIGSLDHVLANDAALADVNAVDIWDINGYESVYYEYSRFNTNTTNLYTANPFRSSDHSPEIVGINTATAGPTTTDVQIIGSNDYHGRLAAGPRLAAYVKAARAANPDTVFAAAGDLVGATTFESFLQHDKPTIDVMNEAGLDVSSVGNHEFDAGYDDLVNRIMAPYDATTNPEGGAEWQYLGANVKFKSDGSDALEGTWIKDFGDVEVGFVGAVTEDLPSLVAGAGIADIEVTDIVDATNAAATDLKTAGADVVVLLVHEGATNTSYASATTPGTAFGDIVNGVSEDVDAIVSGHTHLAYNHSVPVPAWVTEGRAVTERPVVSAGQYGENLNKLVFTVDNATGEVQAKTQAIVPFASFPAQGDAATQAIVDDANAQAAVLGAQPLGKIEAGFSRAKFVGGAENRGGESTLGNLVAEVQRDATGSAIAFMNPGGLRADMLGTGTDYPRTVTYKDAADVQPFGNTIVTMGLTGASIKKVLEQQWQRTAGGTVPARPFLKLGVSDGFEYTYDSTRPEGDRVTGMWLDGVKILTDVTYTVAANSFLASGTGDNFFAFSEATNKRDSGKVDLQTMVDYMADNAPTSNPLGVDYAQRAVGVSGVATDYAVGQMVTLDVSSLAMTGTGDLTDAQVQVEFDGAAVGTFPVDNTANAAGDGNSNDEAGRATVSFRVPDVDAGGSHDVVITGAITGTEVTVPVQVQAPSKVVSTVTASVSPASIEANSGTATIAVDVTGDGGTPTGTVAALIGDRVVGGGELVDGRADVLVGPFTNDGTKTITVRYYGDAANLPSETSVSLTVTPAPAVERATPAVAATISPAKVTVFDDQATVSISVTKTGGVPSGAVLALIDGQVVGAAELVGGRADISLAKFDTVGTAVVQVKYFGDATTKPGATTASVEVVKAEPKMKVKAPKKVKKGTRATIVVTLSATGFDPTGTVTVDVRAKKVTKRVKNGEVTFKIRLTRKGTSKLRVRYNGDDLTESATKTVKVKVKRR